MAADELTMLADTAAAVFTSVGRADLATVWQALDRQGMTRVGVDGDTLDYLEVLVRAAGRAAVSVPVVETHVGATVLAAAGLPDPGGALSVALDPALFGLESRAMVPAAFAGATDQVVVVNADLGVAALSWDALDVDVRRDLAGDPTAIVDISVVATGGSCPLDVARTSALVLLAGRAAGITGAGERALEQSMAYVSEREQFGRTLSKFQAVQQTIAVMAAQVAATSVSVAAAFASIQTDPHEQARIATFAALSQADRMASFVARSAHQLHGAIGFTEEHSLRHATTRLSAWRSSAPSGSELDAALGAAAFDAGTAWDLLAAGRPT
jgi:acyl-CoA dehydrogenase